MTRLVVIGDTLLDRDVEGSVRRIGSDAPVAVVDQEELMERLGGAGLTATIGALRGDTITVITALAKDKVGDKLRKLYADQGIEVIDIGAGGTTKEKVRVRADGQTVLRLDNGTGVECVEVLPEAASNAIASADAVVVSDYGGPVAKCDVIRKLVEVVTVPLVWDPHRNGATPTTNVTVVTPNRQEALGLTELADLEPSNLTDLHNVALELRDRWGCGSIALTIGERGVLYADGCASPMVVPAPEVNVVDVCGAGDTFAITLASELGKNRLISEAMMSAVNAAAAWVEFGEESLGHRAIESHETDVGRLIARVKATGGTVVATGGCFDLLHAGHVDVLNAARKLGDCLIVCLNSDNSVRRLKGMSRPVVGETDRAAVLLGLEAVDAVVVFDENTPSQVLRRLEPDLWVKGGDYTPERIPETPVVAEWGGQTVVLPYLKGRSTTSIVEAVVTAASRRE